MVIKNVFHFTGSATAIGYRYFVMVIKNVFHFTGSATAIGCYKDKISDRALPELLHNYRGRMDWTDLINVVIKKCQLEAKEKVRLAGNNDCPDVSEFFVVILKISFQWGNGTIATIIRLPSVIKLREK